jgi:hypothetical protein
METLQRGRTGHLHPSGRQAGGEEVGN